MPTIILPITYIDYSPDGGWVDFTNWDGAERFVVGQRVKVKSGNFNLEFTVWNTYYPKEQPDCFTLFWNECQLIWENK